MERRDTLKLFSAAAAVALASQHSHAAGGEKKEGDHKKHHGHEAKHAAKTSAAKPAGKVSFSELNHAAAHCNHVAEMCAGHCIALINEGQKSMINCLEGALEVQAISAALSKLAGLRSTLASVQAKASIPAYEKCMKACEPHVHHHEECKECFEACKSSLETCKAFAV